jgi:hypothetical protein
MNENDNIEIVRSDFLGLLFAFAVVATGLIVTLCFILSEPLSHWQQHPDDAYVWSPLFLLFYVTACTVFFILMFHKEVITFDAQSRTTTIRNYSLMRRKDPKTRTIPWSEIAMVVTEGKSVKLALRNSELVPVDSFRKAAKATALRTRLAEMIGLEKAAAETGGS